MDFLKKMFEKKVCSICGKESGLLGNRKLEDGNLCKECTSKLSPWYEERRHATVQKIKNHLDWREENKKILQKIDIRKSFGEYYKVHIGYQGVYPAYFLVSKEQDYVAENADVFFFANLKDCRLDVSEHCTELTKLDENKQRVSYNPPRYEYRYDFNVVLGVDTVYCNEIKFKLNKHPIKVEIEKRRNVTQDPTIDVKYQSFKNMYMELERELVEGMKYSQELMEKTYQMGEKAKREIQEKFEKINEIERQAEMLKQKIANKPKFCPNCGASTATGKGAWCQECGNRLV